MANIIKNYLSIQNNLIGSNAHLTIVTKTIPAENILPLLQAGHRDFGENYIQEASQKWQDLKALYPDIKLHLIGHLQSKKIKQALSLFNIIETLDSEKTALLLKKAQDNLGLARQYLIQVNIGREQQKFGIDPSLCGEFVNFCKNQLRLDVQGLMCIPPHDEDPTPFFKEMQRLKQSCNLPKLSMGMSSDYQIALKYSSDYIRIGTAIFGART